MPGLLFHRNNINNHAALNGYYKRLGYPKFNTNT